jgi:malate dehydrogenase
MKISIVGAGNVGGLAAMHIAEENLGEVFLIDIAAGLAKGKAFDLEDSRDLLNNDFSIFGTDNIDAIKDSGIIVITAGLARKPGMTREELVHYNAQVLKSVCEKIKILSADAIVIIVTNPLDVMTYFASKTIGLKSSKKIFGMGATLDGSRFANLISQELNISPSEIHPCVIGSHGEMMLPLPRFTLVKGKPITEILPKEKIEELVKRTVERGKEIVSLLGSGSAYFAPAAAILEIVRAVVKDQKATLGVSVFLDGEYGEKNICLGLPCVIGKNGIEKIATLDLNPEEKEKFKESAASIRALNRLLNI